MNFWIPVLDRMLRHFLIQGTLIAHLPDGSSHRYGDGTGSPVTVRIHDPALVRVIRSRFVRLLPDSLPASPSVFQPLMPRFLPFQYGKQAAAKHRNVAPDPLHPNAPRPSTSQLPASAHYDSHSQRPMDASIPSSSKSTLSPHSITAQPSADPLTFVCTSPTSLLPILTRSIC